MKMKVSLLLLLLTISLIAAIPLITKPAAATPIPKDPLVVWENGGEANAALLAWNPEYLQLRTEGPVETDTTVIIQGLDTYGQNIEAKVELHGTHERPIPGSMFFPFIDTHSGLPVPFAAILRVFQQNGMHCNSFQIDTLPEPWEDYLGTYHFYDVATYEPGQCYPAYDQGVKYLVGNGQEGGVITQPYPVEPSNPDPLKVVINWFDSDKDLLPDYDDATEFPGPSGGGAKAITTIYVEGLDEHGNKLGGIASITALHQKYALVVTYAIDLAGVWTPESHTWSTVCKVWGGYKGEEYFIFSEPWESMALFEYFIRIDHITIYPLAYDILANPTVPEGITQIVVILRDADGNIVHAREPIIINFATSGGKIQPSCDIIIDRCSFYNYTTLYSDTNARTIRVSCDANVPAHSGGGISVPELNMQAYTEMTFDGINSVFSTAWPIHTLMCGWTVEDCHWEDFPAPGPDPICCPNIPYELNGPLYEVMIPLYVGCNLISSPVYPMFGPSAYDGQMGIPMSLLFGKTSATDTICAIWWYDAESGWQKYIPSMGESQPDAMFRDGIGYWFKVEKPCTLELSGVMMENAPFLPAEYPVHHSWNLMGVTSVYPIATADYLESLATDTYRSDSIASAVGPIWVWNAQYRVWSRDPAWLWPTQGFWMNYKLPGTAFLAP
jgi:hypothetical protein